MLSVLAIISFSSAFCPRLTVLYNITWKQTDCCVSTQTTAQNDVIGVQISEYVFFFFNVYVSLSLEKSLLMVV